MQTDDNDDKPSPEQKRQGKRMLKDIESERENTDCYDTSGSDESSPKTSSKDQ